MRVSMRHPIQATISYPAMNLIYPGYHLLQVAPYRALHSQACIADHAMCACAGAGSHAGPAGEAV